MLCFSLFEYLHIRRKQKDEMINYKDHLKFPFQIQKYNDFVNDKHQKNALFTEDTENEGSNDYLLTNQQLYIANIIDAYENNDIFQLYKHMDFLYKYLVHAQPKIFPSLIDSNIIPLLIELASPENNFEYRKTSFYCLYNITALYSETTMVLLDNGILNIFYEYIYAESSENNKLIQLKGLIFDGIVNILNDEPQLISQVMSVLPISMIIGSEPFDDIISAFSFRNAKILKSIRRLFNVYMEESVLQSDISLIVNFYICCIKHECKASVLTGLEGINDLLMLNKLQEEQFLILTKVDYIDMSDLFNLQCEESQDEQESKEYLTMISLCFEIQSKLFEFSFRSVDYDYRQVLKYCNSHFNDDVGISAFELVDTILTNCEQETYYSFLLCEDMNFLDILYNAITKGSYFIVYPASESLIQVIEGCDDENDRFINENTFEALLKILLMDDEKFQKKAIDAISVIFERCVLSDTNIEDCITAFDVNDGVNIFANCLYSSENDEISEACDRLLSRFFPIE